MLLRKLLSSFTSIKIYNMPLIKRQTKQLLYYKDFLQKHNFSYRILKYEDASLWDSIL